MDQEQVNLKNIINKLKNKITKLESENNAMKKKFEEIDAYYQNLRSKRNAVSDDLYDKTISSKTAKRRQNKFNKKIQKFKNI